MRRIALARNLMPFDNKGFTFLEIILVVLILAIAIVPMVRAFSPGSLISQ